MSAKDILLEVAEQLPPDATLSAAIDELAFRQAVQQGLDELVRGEGVPINLSAPNPVSQSPFRELRILTVRDSIEDGDLTPYSSDDDPFD
jgi:hypothetical protein